jgi:hypothetical protein
LKLEKKIHEIFSEFFFFFFFLKTWLAEICKADQRVCENWKMENGKWPNKCNIFPFQVVIERVSTADNIEGYLAPLVSEFSELRLDY